MSHKSAEEESKHHEHLQRKLRQARMLWGCYICVQAADLVLSAAMGTCEHMGPSHDVAAALGFPCMSKMITIAVAVVCNICLGDVCRYHRKWRKVLQQRNKLRVDVVRYAEKVIHLHAYIDQLEADGFAGDSANEDDDSDGDYMVSVHSVNATVAEQDLHTAGKTDLLQHTMGPMQCASSVECRRPLYNCLLAIQQAGKRLRIAGQEWHKSLAWLRCIFDRVFTACDMIFGMPWPGCVGLFSAIALGEAYASWMEVSGTECRLFVGCVFLCAFCWCYFSQKRPAHQIS